MHQLQYADFLPFYAFAGAHGDFDHSFIGSGGIATATAAIGQ